MRLQALSLGLIPLVTACSVMMAASGKRDPNLGAINIGEPRETVLVHLGQPARTIQNADSTVDVFELERGNEPSMGRAAFHGALDVLTLGAWEIIGTPIEGFAGEKFELTVEYGPDGKVTRIYSGSAGNVAASPGDL